MGLFDFFRKGGGKSSQAVELVLKREPPPGARPLFHIRYTEDFGAETRRDIFPIRMYATEEGVRAWDYLIGEIRLFKFSQMQGVHDNEAGRDIMVRGLWAWCGLPQTDQSFPDEEPGARKQTQWQAAPTAARFRLTIWHRGTPTYEVDFAPKAWATDRRSMFGTVWPEGGEQAFAFADVVSAVDIQSNAVLDRVALWNLVLAHRDDAPPWYVQWADEHLMVVCLIGFARQELGQFRAAMRAQVNSALQAVGYRSLDEEIFKSIIQAMSIGYNGYTALPLQVSLLTDAERGACRDAARAMLESKGVAPGPADIVFNL